MRQKERNFAVHVRLTPRESEMLEELLVDTLKQGRMATLSSVLRACLTTAYNQMRTRRPKR